MGETTWIIAGLGNPGKKYYGTRHNVGFHIVDRLAEHFGFSVSGNKWDGLYHRTQVWGQPICFVKPQTFMNRSGQAVARFAGFYKTPMNRILIIHDDIDMHCGRLKLVTGGGSGGHNGIRSIISCLGTGDFHRLKFGVGRPQQLENGKGMGVEKYVLAPFSGPEKEIVNERFDPILEGIELLVQGDKASALNCINSMK